ncbi:peptidylprolyl isomerase [Marinicauda algicola]|uniref:Peptidyl-prolyl cis-trans isomerase n=1 Tax=Marinicauda algicola TaxID=2029849 RepID=A0A4S2H244_9PROT|nr:peptidylprolyl isomerase [Marinicauda algicola]TGY89667.1 peptidylprolyl isomerase [Marinicauda algicola]
MADTEKKLVFTLEGGDVTIRLRPDLAPRHVDRICELAEQGFYDGLTFHRVIDGFVAQGGCPKGTGTGGTGKKIPAEFSKEKHVRGTMSMARTMDPNSADCQFFICLDAVPYLDEQYTVWGEVESGMEHVDALPKGEPPRKPGKIIKAEVVEA